MRLFLKLFFSYLLVVLFAELLLVVLIELLAPRFFAGHVARMVETVSVMGMGPMAEALKVDLERSLAATLNSAFLAALPLAFLASGLVAYFVSRKLTRTAEMLAEASRRVAAGDYRVRLPVLGRDELSELAAQFNRLAEALARVEETRAELIGNVAHELRTPLAALQGYAEALADGVLAPARAASAIAREVRAMARLVEDLAQVSRVEAGAVALRLRPVPPRELVERALSRFREAFTEKGVALVAPAFPELPPVLADPERVDQVFANLLKNALAHTPKGGRVTLTLAKAPEEVRFCIADTGPGVPPEYAERIFERFFRGDPARRRAGSPRKKRSKIRSAYSGGTPGPVSAMQNRTSSGAFASVRVTRPPFGVWARAFFRRLAKTWSTRSGSASTGGSSGKAGATSATPFSVKASRKRDSARSTSSRGGTGRRRRATAPASTRETWARSSTSRAIARTSRAIAEAARAGASTPSASASA